MRIAICRCGHVNPFEHLAFLLQLSAGGEKIFRRCRIKLDAHVTRAILEPMHANQDRGAARRVCTRFGVWTKNVISSAAGRGNQTDKTDDKGRRDQRVHAGRSILPSRGAASTWSHADHISVICITSDEIKAKR